MRACRGSIILDTRYAGRVSLPPIAITDVGDPRIAVYRDIKERALAADSGRFVAESERVVRRLIGSGLRVASVLLTPARLATLADALGGPFPVYLAAQEVLDRIAGFHVHRGCLAIGLRPSSPPWPLPPPGPRAVVVLEDLTDVDNLGAIARHAAAFGVDALVLSPRCADPFYRKSIRVSLGAVLELPIVRLGRWPDDLATLRAAGLTLIAAVLDPAARPLRTFTPPAKFALLLGAEGPGLSEAARAAADHQVTIPMSAGADSLNVATAGAIFLYALTGTDGN
jgi:tRNA G18 (ribose-2'-O)-methylase SpoU